MKSRFIVITSATGCVLILDSTKKEGQEGRAVAHFFQDKSHPGKAEMLANLCAKTIEEEAARRAAKG